MKLLGSLPTSNRITPQIDFIRSRQIVNFQYAFINSRSRLKSTTSTFRFQLRIKEERCLQVFTININLCRLHAVMLFTDYYINIC